LSSTGVYLSAALYAEALYIPLVSIGLALLVTRSRALAFGAGVAFGAAELARALALPVFAVAIVFVTLTRGWRSSLLLAAGFALPAALTWDTRVFTAGAHEALLGHNALAASLLDRVATLFIVGGWPPFGE